MPKKLTYEERKKLAQEIIMCESAFDLSILGPSKKPRKSFKPPLEKLTSYHIIVEGSVFWSSRQAYLEVIQSFLSKKIDGEAFTSKYFELRSQDMLNTDELCARIEDQIRPIPDLYYTFKATDFSLAINDLFLEIDRYDPDVDDRDYGNIVYSESQLRSVIQKEFVPLLQQSCDLNDSFFRPQDKS